MSFLAPLFFLGALAVGLPIVFHLIRRSSREKVQFSSLMFLQPSPPRLTRRSRLEHLFLLLLRCVVICLLAFAFARPFFQKPILANLAPDAGRKIILLVDTSASMRRDGVWPAALAKADEVLRKTSPADQVAVFTFDNQMRQVVSFEQWSQMNASERAALASSHLAQITPGWAGTHLGSALLAGAEAFTEADKQSRNLSPQRIVLISDLQEGSRLDGLQGYDWPRGTDVQIERIAPRRPTNAGLQWVADAPDSTKGALDAPPRVRVSNSGNAQHEQFQLHWEGVPAALPLDIYVPPGQSRIIEVPKLPTNIAGEQLVLTGDDDSFDDTLYLLRPKAEQITVLYSGDEAETDTTQSLFYLKRAFQQTRQQDVEIIARSNSAPFAPAELAKARLFVAADRVADERLGVAQEFLSAGGTLLLVATTSAAETVGRLAGVEGFNADEITATNYAMLGLVEFNHPLFAPFSDPRYNDFTKIHFWKYRRVDATRLADARVLARFDSGDPALIEIPKGKGRLLVLASGWQPADSQLALSSKFVPLLYSILDLAGGMHTSIAQFQVGQSVDVAQFGIGSPGASAEPVNVLKPDGSKVALAPGETRFSQADQPGIYTVANSRPLGRFAVNLDPAESRTAPLPFDHLERLGVPLKPRELEMAKQVERKQQLHAAELENQQKLWRWLTLAAVVVLLGETSLAGWLTQRGSAKAGVAT